MEGLSIWNREYFVADAWSATGVSSPENLPPFYFPRVVGSFGEAFRIPPFDKEYPQVSRWYIPSIDELAFIAHQLVKVPQLHSKFKVKIGDTEAFGGSGTNWVWSSTGAFDETKADEFLQKGITGEELPPIYPNYETYDPNNPLGITYEFSPNPRNVRIRTDPFTKAWAMKFGTEPNSSGVLKEADFKVKKEINDVTRYELRPIRLIRCDQRYMDNSTPEKLRNSCWYVPRLTRRVVGWHGYYNGPGIAAAYTPDNFNPTKSNYDPETETLYKNKIPPSGPNPKFFI